MLFTGIFKLRSDLPPGRSWSTFSEMNVLVSGTTGLVGSALLPALQRAGHSVTALAREGAQSGTATVSWSPENGRIESAKLAGVQAVIHLAGENIADGRWTKEKKQRIRGSRVKGTDLLARAIIGMPQPPQVFVCASAIGIYGNRGEEWLTEDSSLGNDFLAGVCREWEAATVPLIDAGIRVVHLRFGVILSPKGGALAKMLPIFQMGAGGPAGDGGQYVSWITLGDAVGVILQALQSDSLSGPVNVVTPGPLTNRELAKALGEALGRPAVMPAPAFALKLAFGEMAEATVLASQRVKPARLQAAGYAFQHPDITSALQHLLKD